MTVAGGLVVVEDRRAVTTVRQRLQRLAGVEIVAQGPKGIAVVLEGADSKTVADRSKEIRKWPEVADFQLGYLNWEEEGSPDSP